MKIQQFLQHHGLGANPFTDEDAQSDLVFKSGCIRQVYHPAWDKIYGDPAEPATAVVFGEKGSGKTAMRLQIVRHLADYNAEQPDRQVFVVQYDDFNPYLDRFRERLSGRRRRADRALGQWRLWDHMDAILAQATTQLVDRILGAKQARHPAARDENLSPARLDLAQKRDVLLLAACYDQSPSENLWTRWRKLQQALGLGGWFAKVLGKWDWAVGVAVTHIVVLALALMGHWDWLLTIWPHLIIAAGWAPWAWRLLKRQLLAWRLARNLRTLNQPVGPLRRVLGRLTAAQLVGQPLPAQPRTDDRYELLAKLQGVLRAFGFGGMIVLVDRVDEPYLINGSTDLMRALVWPLLDNKLLKHPGLGLKVLLPIELERLIDREDRDFHQRARLDKQNLVRGLPWTGQSLYDCAAARVRACAAEGAAPTLDDWFEPAVNERRLVEAFGQLRVPRNLAKFMYRLMTAHCNAHSDGQPVWQIASGTFESVLALYLRDQDAFDRGVGAG
jgi:hypothetical protein